VDGLILTFRVGIISQIKKN